MTAAPQLLPRLDDYRAEFAAEGAPQPLPLVPAEARGLLAALPSVPADRRGWPWTIETPRSLYAGTDWPRITLVTPSYQQGAYLEETIRSVLLQNYPNLEYVVCDGGSADGSAAVIERYRPWLSFARVAPDRGQGHAINLGMSLAGGELRGWLNSDDFLLPGALHRAVQTRGTAADVIYGDALQLEQASGRLRLSPANFAHGRYVKYPGLLHSHATFWSRARHQPVWEEQHCALDYELWIRLLPGARLRHVAWPLAVAREHSAAKTYDPGMQRRWLADAERNGRVHPDLYRPQPWRDREHRFVQRFVRGLRSRNASATVAAICRECGWDPARFRSAP